MNLRTARRITSAINWISALISIHGFFFVSEKWPLQTPYLPTVFVLIAYPLLVILVVRLSDGKIQLFNDEEQSVYPNAFGGLVPAFIVGLRALMDFNLYSTDGLWTRSALLSAILATVILMGNKEFRYARRTWKWWLGLVFMFGLSFYFTAGSLVVLNCGLDHSTPDLFKTEVVDKRITESNKRSTYYLELAPWHTRTKVTDCKVGFDTYERTQTGDSITLLLRPGRFGYPWYEVGGVQTVE